jgi:hypothetical protein
MTSDDLTPERALEIAGWTEEGQPRVSSDAFDRILAAWQRDRARLATVTAWVDALVPLVPIVDAFVEDGCQRSQWFGTVELTQIATARHHHAAIRAERATTGGTDADE